MTEKSVVPAAGTTNLPAAGGIGRAKRYAGEPVATAFKEEEVAGLRLGLIARLVVLLVSAGWLWLNLPLGVFVFVMATFVAFVVNAWVHYRLARTGRARPWHPYLFVTIDFALLTFSMFGWLLFFDVSWPPQIMLRQTTFVFFFVFLANFALSYSPWLMLWAGVAGAGTLSVGVVSLLLLPDTIVGNPDLAADPGGLFLNPTYVDIPGWLQIVLALVLTAGVLAVVVWRSRRLVIRQAEATRQRTNLARYFAPTMVDRLAGGGADLQMVRVQPVVVMFVDIVGFTKIAESLTPEASIALLRGFHERVEAAVFEHGGTLDKFLGDGVMATFGTPETGSHDAVNALAAASAIVNAVADWNEASDQPALTVSVGLHHGECVLGDIGSDRRMEFAVLGDAVNVASRLEHLTRDLDCQIVASAALVEAARQEDAEVSGRLLASYSRKAAQPLRGRTEPVDLWIGSALTA